VILTASPCSLVENTSARSNMEALNPKPTECRIVSDPPSELIAQFDKLDMILALVFLFLE
jgi:hypothetical protein